MSLQGTSTENERNIRLGKESVCLDEASRNAYFIESNATRLQGFFRITSFIAVISNQAFDSALAHGLPNEGWDKQMPARGV